MEGFKDANGAPWFSRSLEEDLANSAPYSCKNHHMGYWVQGLLGVGKTSLLEKFGKDRYKTCISFDLSDEKTRISVEEELDKAFSDLGYSAYDKRHASKAFSKLIPNFADDPSTLLILDEIQDSRSVYNRARKIVRGLEAKSISQIKFMACTRTQCSGCTRMIFWGF